MGDRERYEDLSAPGLIHAVEAMWPEADRPRYWVHKMRNVLDKVPEEARPVLKP